MDLLEKIIVSIVDIFPNFYLSLILNWKSHFV
jgi:hypothetical protein